VVFLCLARAADLQPCEHPKLTPVAPPPMSDEHDRLAIRAIIKAAHPVHITKVQIANEAGTWHSSTAFKRKFDTYEGEVGRGWKCTEATLSQTRGKPRIRGKQYELA
jgi:hypothetical protein